jgi:hypothetical protein
MRKYFYINLIAITLLTLTTGCTVSIFVPDPIDPRLPKYTEGGNNVAGAFIDQEVWKSQNYIEYVPTWGYMDEKVVHRMASITTDSIKNSLILRLDGQISSDSTTLEFRLVGLNIYSFNDLALLNDKKIQLDGSSNMGVIIRHNGKSKNIKYFKNGGVGQLNLRNVSVVDSTKSAIFSGTFGFSVATSPNETCKISYGRFDYFFPGGINLSIK